MNTMTHAFAAIGVSPRTGAQLRADLIASGAINPERVPRRVPCTHAPVLALDDVGRLAACHEILTGEVTGRSDRALSAREVHEATAPTFARAWAQVVPLAQAIEWAKRAHTLIGGPARCDVHVTLGEVAEVDA